MAYNVLNFFVSFYCRRIWTSESLPLNRRFAHSDVSTVSAKNKPLTLVIVSLDIITHVSGFHLTFLQFVLAISGFSKSIIEAVSLF